MSRSRISSPTSNGLISVPGLTRSGKMPNLTILPLPSNHTFGTQPGVSTPKAMVVDNDLALGRVVEGLTRSPFWKKMAIFVVEDDAQNGVDHVRRPPDGGAGAESLHPRLGRLHFLRASKQAQDD